MSLLCLHSPSVRPALIEFSKLLKKCVGPRGRLLLAYSKCGQLTLTTSAKRVLASLDFHNPVLIFLVQTINSHISRFGDGGLYNGIVLSSLYCNVLSADIPVHVACHILASFRSVIQSELRHASSPLHVKVSLETVQPLLIIAKTVLTSKPGAFGCNSDTERDHANAVVYLMVNGFLKAGGLIGKILLKILVGSEKPQLINGLLYNCVDGEHHLLATKDWTNVSLALVTVMLSDGCDSSEKPVSGVECPWDGRAQLKAAQEFTDLAAKCGVQVVACQKVVHPSILLAMRRRGVLTLQRLGSRLTEELKFLSGATPISSLNAVTSQTLSSFQGCLRSVKHVQMAEKDVIVVSGFSDVNVSTLVLPAHSSAAAEEVEIVARQALFALKAVVEDGVLVPGGGCSETYLCSLLCSKVFQCLESFCGENNCSISELETVLHWLQLSLLHAVGMDTSKGTGAVDTIYHHAWGKAEYTLERIDQEICCCGLISAADVIQKGGSWIELSHQYFKPMFPSDWVHNPQSAGLMSSKRLKNDVSSIVLDVLSSKCNAFVLAVDNCLGLCNVGAVVISHDGKSH